ncbi:DENN domain-containing protein 11-like [Ruditapes philippinarum]|uniref:DENN domain-containing protein 11-like n=1 Tax=Ruditapes philippinarum TaxID=129788 RepID=UPI00295A937A|nr:DENN domain-containing protein 11-like [Ruditapes philippinarum]
MAEEERAPLLTSEAGENNHTRQRKRPNIFPTEPVRSNAVCADDRIFVNATVSTPSEIEPDVVVAIFVVAFDTRSGNMVEWSMPEDADLDGIEFKAMVSGSHTQLKDFVYFKKDSLYGLACFENMPVDSEIERGARMKSVGILATSYTLLYRHLQFLETQVRHQLETPGKYTQLQAFYEDKTTAALLALQKQSKSTTPTTPSRDLLPELKITHPAGCFTQFAKFFGEQIFILWKYALLEKRILFFSPPPIGVVCYRVYCACCLANHDLRGLGRRYKPQFYVNVADIETLESEVMYIACTTEKIFETKTSLYDVYVDNQIVRTHSPILKDLLKCSSADREKFQKLNNLRSAHQFSYEELGEETIDEEEVFVSFFHEQNNRLFQTLLDVANSQDTQLTSDHMKSMGLDPQGDRQFLMELVEHYGIDVVLMVDNPCCPK